MKSLSNIWKNAAVSVGEPFLIREKTIDTHEQRMAWLRREEEVRGQERDAYRMAKAQGIRMGEEAGRHQGDKEGAQQIKEQHTRRESAVKAAREAQAEAFSETDADCQRQALDFANALSQKIFGRGGCYSVPADREMLPRETEETARKHLSHNAEKDAVEPQMPLNALPALDEQEIREAADLAFEDGPASGQDMEFTELARLPARRLQKILKNVKIRDLAVALKGMDAKGSAALLNALPKHLRETARQELEFLGPVSMEETGRIQKQILRLVSQL